MLLLWPCFPLQHIYSVFSSDSLILQVGQVGLLALSRGPVLTPFLSPSTPHLTLLWSSGRGCAPTHRTHSGCIGFSSPPYWCGQCMYLCYGCNWDRCSGREVWVCAKLLKWGGKERGAWLKPSYSFVLLGYRTLISLRVKTILHSFVCIYVHAVVHVCSEGTLQKSSLSFYHVGARDQTQFFRLGSKCLYQLS